MKQYIISFICFSCLLLSGCNYLDTEPGDAISGDYFWETANAAALEQYCNLYYPKLIKGHGDPLSWNVGAMIMADYQSDNILVSGGSSITYGQNTKLTSNSDWNWSTVRGCNSFLQNYQRSPASEMDKKKYAGEILFFKAFDYYNKVRPFGDVPWYDTALDKDDPDLYKGRDSRIVVMASILKTINQAIEFLPRKTKVYRVSRDAALLLKARICLYEGTWRRYRDMEGDVEYLKEAYNAAGELMDYGYSLYKASATGENYFDLFIQDNYNGNPEIILSREYDPAINEGHNVSSGIPNGEMGMSRDCFEEYLCSNTGKPISLCGCHHPNMGYNAEMKNRDGRLLQTLCLPEPGRYARYLYREDGGSLKGGAPNIYTILPNSDTRTFYGASCTGYSICKFYKASEFLVGNHKGGIDAPVMRYAEALLIRVEAGAELGEDPELDKTVNALRARAGFTFKLDENPLEDPDLVAKYPDIKGPNKNLIREIRRERRVELFAEGYRWDDVCRWNVGEIVFNRVRRGAKMDPDLYTTDEIKTIRDQIGFDQDGFITPYAKKITYSMNFKAKNYLYNIPLDEISLNPNLLPQNPGWE